LIENDKIYKLESEVSTLNAIIAELKKVSNSPKVSLKEYIKTKENFTCIKSDNLSKTSEIQNLKVINLYKIRFN